MKKLSVFILLAFCIQVQAQQFKTAQEPVTEWRLLKERFKGWLEWLRGEYYTHFPNAPFSAEYNVEPYNPNIPESRDWQTPGWWKKALDQKNKLTIPTQTAFFSSAISEKPAETQSDLTNAVNKNDLATVSRLLQKGIKADSKMITSSTSFSGKQNKTLEALIKERKTTQDPLRLQQIDQEIEKTKNLLIDSGKITRLLAKALYEKPESQTV